MSLRRFAGKPYIFPMEKTTKAERDEIPELDDRHDVDHPESFAAEQVSKLRYPYNTTEQCSYSEFPAEVDQAESLLLDLGITHLLSLSPAQLSSAVLPSSTKHFHINVSDHEQTSLLLALPSACKFIQDAISKGGQVLVHCLTESRACVVVCAFCESFNCLPSPKSLTHP